MSQQAMLTEALDLSGVKVDKEKAIIYGVKVSGRQSRNHRNGKRIRYADDAITESCQLFDRCPVTIRGGHDRTRRDALSQNGQLREGRVEAPGTEEMCSRFNWYLNPKHSETPRLLEDAEQFPENIPISLEVLEWKERSTDDAVIIEHLTADKHKGGVALVYKGGLNKSLFEDARDLAVEIKTKEELRAHYSKLCEELEECACQKSSTELADLKKQLETAIAEREAARLELDKVKGQLEEWQAKEARVEHEKEIRAKAKEILGEERELDEQLLGVLLERYEEQGYVAMLQSIRGMLTGAAEPPTDPQGKPPGPTSSSGTQSTFGKSTGVNGRRRMGMRNLRA